MAVPRTEITISRQGQVLSRSELRPGRYLIGSGAADLKIDGPGVSPVHACLSVNAHLLTVEDLGSEHGTFINDERLSEPTRLFPNQTLKLGPEVELSAHRLRDSVAEEDTEASLTIQQAYVDRLLPPELRQRLKYVMNGKVASGGMGTVHRAREMTIRREVAMKVMLGQASEGAIARFIKEAQVTGQLEHPNIVPIHELGVDDQDQLYYTMKYVQGVTLKDVLDGLAKKDPEMVRKFPLQRLLSILDKVCDAVAFAHSRWVVHRDLKPDNIMLGKFGEVLVMDWGLSLSLAHEPGGAHLPNGSAGSAVAPAELVSLLSSDAPMPEENGLAGTPQYMSPEQARGELDAIDTRCDIYALGAILFHILYLERPIPGTTVKEVLSNVRKGHTRLETVGPRSPHADGQFATGSLGAVVRKAMALETDARYATVEELQAEIRNYSSGFATRAEEAGVTRHLMLGLVRYKKEVMWFSAFVLVGLAMGSVALVRLLQERKRAETALANLRDMAPTFLAQAEMLARQGQYGDALGRIEDSLALQPNAVPAYLLKGDLNEALIRLPDAATAYRKALELDPENVRAKKNAELCERLMPRMKDGAAPDREVQTELYQAMTAENRPAYFLVPLGVALGAENQLMRKHWEERLNQLVVPVDRGWDSRLKMLATGQLAVDLSDTAVSDLRLLADMPVETLDLRSCAQVSDLTPLQNLRSLKNLKLDHSGVKDLSPLKNLKLEELSIADTAIADLSPLAGLPLRQLDCSRLPPQSFSALARTTQLERLTLSGCSPGNLAFLRGLPLRYLNLDGCGKATGFSALKDLRDLEEVILPDTYYQLSANDLLGLRDLRGLPQLRRIMAGAELLTPVRDGSGDHGDLAPFWEAWEDQLNWLAAVHSAYGTVSLAEDGLWEVDLTRSAVADISFLKGVRLRKLVLLEAPVVDLHPLEGMPLEVLDLRKTNVTDLEPLRGLPLKELYLWENPVTDFKVISAFPDLEVLDLTQTPFSDLSLLKSRRMKLLRIGSTRVTDLSPLAGMHLEKLHCDSVQVPSIRPLLEVQGLTWLIAPKSATDLDLLENVPTLERISYESGSESLPTKSAKEFWSERKPKK